MQTFLTSTDHNKTARSLDSKRLYKNLLEGYQLIRAGIVGPGFSKHPAKIMWVGYESHFVLKYLAAMTKECLARNINADETYLKCLDFFRDNYDVNWPTPPPWLTDPVIADKIITTHRANLYLKDPIHYADWAGDVKYYRDQICCAPENRPKNSPCRYHWPSHIKDLS